MKIMNIKILILVCFVLTFFNIGIFAQAKDKVSKVVIDAGHGGSDPGAVSKLCQEKDINLNVALRVGKLISSHFNDVAIIYTREKDEKVELFKRAEIANKSKADLFISIHCNSAESKDAAGVETFVMGVGKTTESIAVAKKENAAILMEKDYKTTYSNFDPNSPEAYIIFSLYSSTYLNLSTILASRVQNHLVANTKMADRTVLQAGFWVLYKVAMPSILIELGFISNPEEEKYLIREDTQELLAISIYNAFVEYKNLLEGTLKPYLPVPKVSKNYQTIELKETIKSNNITNSEKLLDTLPNTEVVLQIENISNDTIILEIEAPADAIVSPPVNTDTVIPTKPKLVNPDIRFRIQFFTSKENLNTSDKKFSSFSDIKKYNENGIWKYTSGEFKTFEEAQARLKDIRNSYSDAFIVAFNKEHRISIPEALELLK